MRISDWSSDVCSSDLQEGERGGIGESGEHDHRSSTSPSFGQPQVFCEAPLTARCAQQPQKPPQKGETRLERLHHQSTAFRRPSILGATRSEEHTSELQSLMRISYAVFCLKKKKT